MATITTNKPENANHSISIFSANNAVTDAVANNTLTL